MLVPKIPAPLERIAPGAAPQEPISPEGGGLIAPSDAARAEGVPPLDKLLALLKAQAHPSPKGPRVTVPKRALAERINLSERWLGVLLGRLERVGRIRRSASPRGSAIYLAGGVSWQ